MFFFSDNGVKCQVTCTLKLHCQGKEWYKTTTKILKKIKGVSYTLVDTKDGGEGMIHISGKLDSEKFVKMIEKQRNRVEIVWISSEQSGGGMGNNNYFLDPSMQMSTYPPPYHHHHHHQYHRGMGMGMGMYHAPPTPYYDHQYQYYNYNAPLPYHPYY